MKMKSLAMIASVGFLASAVTYIAPAMADENFGDNNIGEMQNLALDTSMQAQNNNDAENALQTSDNMRNSNSSAELGSPDTATGDDDY